MPPKMRDDIANTYFYSLLRALSAVVDGEAAKLRATDFQLNEVYPAWALTALRQRVNPILWAFQSDIVEATSLEKAVNFDIEPLAGFRQKYIADFDSRYIGSHQGQLKALATKLAMAERINEWTENNKEALKKAYDEKVRCGSAIFRQAIFSHNRPVTWHTRGKSCPYCRALNGRKIWRRDPWFVRPGDAVDSGEKDAPPMRSYSGCGHCPLHQKCDCFIS